MATVPFWLRIAVVFALAVVLEYFTMARRSFALAVVLPIPIILVGLAFTRLDKRLRRKRESHS